MKTEMDWAKEIVGNTGDYPVIIELGAHHGSETMQIYDSCHPCPGIYLAVEADPRALPILLHSIGNRRVHVVHAAIADHCGEIEFHQSDGRNFASSSIRTPKDHLIHFPDIRFDRTVVVPCLTLNQVAEQFKLGYYSESAEETLVDLIWCDVQGAERDMVLGGNVTLERTRFLIAEADQCEMYEGQATRDQLIAMLPGFDVIDQWPENANLLFRNRNL